MLTSLKHRLRNGDLALGLIARVVRGGEIALIARQSGHDFLFIDGQHAAFSRETIGQLAIAAQAAGIPALVRVKGFDDPEIALLLDAGAAGIIVPDVSTAEQARAVVRAAKFPPAGARSFAGPVIGLGYAGLLPGDAAARMNDEVLIVCMIENREGLAQVEDIAAVDGVDVLHIGCGDLLMDLGLPGAFDSPVMAQAVAKVLSACKASGKVCGFGGDRNRDRQRSHIADGVRFVTTQTDVALLIEGATAGVKALR